MTVSQLLVMEAWSRLPSAVLSQTWCCTLGEGRRARGMEHKQLETWNLLANQSSQIGGLQVQEAQAARGKLFLFCR